jgi:hypothetical protein
MAERKRAVRARTDQSAEELTYEEAGERYLHEWILLKITRVSEEGVTTHGRVIDHSRSRKRISKTLARFWEGEPDAHVVIYVGGTRHVTGDEFRKAIAEAAERDYVNARW